MTPVETGAAGGRIDRSALARLLARGADSKDLLDRLATNDLGALAPGGGAPTFFLERTGRVIDRVLVLERGGDAVLIGSAGRAAALSGWLTRHVIADDVEIVDFSEGTVLQAVFGAAAPRALEAGLGVDAAALGPWEHRASAVLEGVTVARAEDIAGRSFLVLAPRPALAAVEAALAALPRVSDDAWRALRIEAGVPAFGEDFTERTIPLETRQLDHISFTKGCYVGQEVIARLHNQKRVKRVLVRLRIEGASPPAAGATLVDGEAAVGVVTSAAASGDGTVALGYVETGREAPGGRLVVRDGDARRAGEILPLTPR